MLPLTPGCGHHLSQFLDPDSQPCHACLSVQDKTQNHLVWGRQPCRVGDSTEGWVLLLEVLAPGPASILTQHSQADGGGGAQEMHNGLGQMSQVSRGGAWIPCHQLPLGFLLQGMGMVWGQLMSFPGDLAGPEPGSCKLMPPTSAVLHQVLPTCWNKHCLVAMVILMALG